MTKITIVGSGFSAIIAKIFFAKYQPDIISCNDPSFIKKNFKRRKFIELNKLFLKRAFSYSNLKLKT